jgi:hypothetical protein
MPRHTMALRASAAVIALGLLATASLGGGPALAQQAPADLNSIPPVPTDYKVKKTAWGDPDFRATWTIEHIPETRILFQRPKGWGNRVWLTEEEYQKRVASATRSDGAFTADNGGLGTPGTEGLAEWVKNDPMARRTSMLIDPPDGQVPAMTPAAEALYHAGRSDWVPKQEFDWVDDFDSWDRCVSRGFPASMFPFRYNNGIRIFQSPGYMIIYLEMLGTRVVRIGNAPKWPGQVEAWMGDSRGHWEGNTLVIETTNIKSGDSATHDVSKRAASPLNEATQNVPLLNTIPTSTKAHTVERLTMTGPNTLTYEITYDDPEVYTKPWTARLDWDRNDNYFMAEYACHEGDVQVRNYITASRAKRNQIAEGKLPANAADGRETFAQQFDFDPVAPGAPQFGPPPGGRPPSAPAPAPAKDDSKAGGG